ncbi:MAG: TIM-barrel domain-containing protein [Lachnotalea sp.]
MNYVISEEFIEFDLADAKMRLEPISENIIRCVYTKEEIVKNESLIINRVPDKLAKFTVFEMEDFICVSTNKITAYVHKNDGFITWREKDFDKQYLMEGEKTLSKIDVIRYNTGNEKPVINRVKTVDGERNFIQNLKPYTDRTAYRGKLNFNWQEKEEIYGLGQAEEGIYNYRNHNQYLYQHNMRIPMPMFLSTNGYGILVDCCSLMTFNDDENGSYLYLDTIDQIDYYFIAGQNPDEIISGFRYLTGKAAMLPKWAYGYIQSKEQYYTAQELVEIIRHYRELDVPIDGVVQDWNSWAPGNWGEKLVDKTRYGDLKECMAQIHDLNAHAMVSVWPNMNMGGKNHTEFLEAGYLLNDLSTYDAFNEDARKMYWKQAKEELFDSGFDAWWCDSTEPFSGPDWNGELKREPWERFELVGSEHKKYLDPQQANAYALVHAKGIYENQKQDNSSIRVLNLTRSGYASGQKYAAMLWSGDTCATWEILKKQIIEGLNVGLSGYPYWTLDIGAFFTVGSKWENRGCGCNTDSTPKWFWKGNYNEGVKDAGYRELYVRWLEIGTFLPMFRSHGTDTPREIWNFGKKGDIFYDAIEKFIKLRYRFMPYIYSLAGAVRLKNATIMRSLLFDFMKDEKSRKVRDGFLFGPSMLVYAVTEPMYYDSENIILDKEKNKLCYLPEGVDWYDYWTNQYYVGGTEIVVDTPIDKIPIFIKAGTILPIIEGIQYAEEIAKTMEIHVYPGADGSFTLYEDEGNNYNYENGAYSTITMLWDNENKQFIFGNRYGEFEGMEVIRNFTLKIVTYNVEVEYNGLEQIIQYMH